MSFARDTVEYEPYGIDVPDGSNWYDGGVFSDIKLVGYGFSPGDFPGNVSLEANNLEIDHAPPVDGIVFRQVGSDVYVKNYNLIRTLRNGEATDFRGLATGTFIIDGFNLLERVETSTTWDYHLDGVIFKNNPELSWAEVHGAGVDDFGYRLIRFENCPKLETILIVYPHRMRRCIIKNLPLLSGIALNDVFSFTYDGAYELYTGLPDRTGMTAGTWAYDRPNETPYLKDPRWPGLVDLLTEKNWNTTPIG